MKLTIYRLIPIILVLDVAALLVSGIGRFKNAHHGVDFVVGEIAWFCFLAGLVALIALAVLALARRARRTHGASA